ncbi:hypothetical protein V2P69_04450 [Mycoplasma capricolum subsp. capricolum]|uniref:Mbov_0395 family pilin-like conjugal transfer protein n=1 Tax=Mycoplasma capricolum TaxID=2095 RepID=UPI003DA5A0F8
MKDLLNVYLFAETNAANPEAIKQNLAQLAQQVQLYINIILGSIAGLLVLTVLVISAIAWFKGSNSDNAEKRVWEFTKIKWFAGFFIFIIVAWGISGIVTAILQNIWKV